ncbi:MAG: MBL fold metallo-hydrolase [Prolixibacteraceae bacterium]|nr:MBL fold metallo-hydrolase [Prolixibacteraceae bacterium]
MKVTFLGTGTSQGVPVVACDCRVCKSDNPLDKRLRASLLVEVDGLKLVIDAGPDFRQQMLRANIKKLSGILLTHEHYDHIAGLDDIRAFNWVQKHPTDIYAEHRVHQSVKRIFSYVFASKKYPGIPQMNLHEISEEPFQIESTTIIPIRALHMKLPVLGYRIENFAYLTDIKTIEKSELYKLENLDVLVLNALRKEPHISHMTLYEALSLIEEVKPRKALLTHLSHQMGTYEEISALLPGNVSLAYDGLELFL